MTGADGTTTFTLKQDQTTGLKTELTAALDSSSSTKSTLPVVFTVLTSPDSPKAKFWGHMAETATGDDGLIYRRPLLRDENSATTSIGTLVEEGEAWSTFPSGLANDTSINGCGAEYVPTDNELRAIYAHQGVAHYMMLLAGQCRGSISRIPLQIRSLKPLRMMSFR